jgi:hypothetical protein
MNSVDFPGPGIDSDHGVDVLVRQRLARQDSPQFMRLVRKGQTTDVVDGSRKATRVMSQKQSADA